MAQEINLTEFDGGLSVIYRHHQEIMAFYTARRKRDHLTMFSQFMNMVTDLVPEMDDKERQQLEKDIAMLRNDEFKIIRSKNSQAMIRDFMHKLEDTFNRYMITSKSKGLQMRNAKNWVTHFS